MLSRLYNERPEYRNPAVQEAAQRGVQAYPIHLSIILTPSMSPILTAAVSPYPNLMQFLREKTFRPIDNRVYFCVTEDGRPIKLQRKVFAECFYVMALSEYARTLKIAGDADQGSAIFAEACSVFDSIRAWSADLSLVIC